MRLGSRQRYKSGAFHIYEALGCEATPVALSCGLVWPQRKWTMNYRRKCVVEFMEPIPPGLDKDTFMREIETRIESRTMELIEEHGESAEIIVARDRQQRGSNNEDKENVQRTGGVTA